jgi:hypothetical protein
MFDRNKSTGDYLTRDEASKVVADLKTEARGAFVSQEDAAAYSGMLNALDERVQELENLARELRRGGSAAPLPTRTPGASLTAEAVTRADAQSLVTAVQQLRTDAQNQFASLATAVAALRNSVPQGDAEATTNSVDYGAVAFGLSEIARKVRGLVVNHGATSGALEDEYKGAVQYFADVFAKSDTEFDADAFKRQSGV